MKIKHNMNVDEVITVVYTVYNNYFDGRLDWILDNDINGDVYQYLDHAYLMDFGIHSFGKLIYLYIMIFSDNSTFVRTNERKMQNERS